MKLAIELKLESFSKLANWGMRGVTGSLPFPSRGRRRKCNFLFCLLRIEEFIFIFYPVSLLPLRLAAWPPRAALLCIGPQLVCH